MKGGTKEQIAQWVLRKIGALKELNELKLHAALIGTDIEQETKLQALLTSKDMKDGLTSKYPEVKAAYTSLRDVTVLRLQEIAARGGPAALAAAKAIRPTSIRSPARARSRSVAPGATRRRRPSCSGRSRRSTITTAVVSAGLSRVGNLMRASSPPGPDSPLHEIDHWGYRTGEAWALPVLDRVWSLATRIRAPWRRSARACRRASRRPGWRSPPRASAPAFPASAAVRPGSGALRPVVIEHIDARGHDHPEAVGEAVRQGVADAVAVVLRDETSRGTTGVAP
jgi:hypothetical protein